MRSLALILVALCPRMRSCAATAGRCARSRYRRTGRSGFRQLRYFGDPLVARAQCRRAGAALSRGAVNAVAFLKDGRIATAGADAHIAIWTPGEPQPDKVLEGHTAPIAGARGVARRRDACLGILGSHRAAVAARRAVSRACSRAMRKTSTVSRSRRTAPRW